MEEERDDFKGIGDVQENNPEYKKDIEKQRKEELLDALADLYEKVQVETIGNDVITIEELKEIEILEIEKLMGRKLWGFKKVVKFQDVRHVYTQHGQGFETLLRQRSIETEDFLKIVDVLTSYSHIEYQPYDANTRKVEALIYYKNDLYEVVMKINFRRKELALKTMWIKK